MSRERAIAYLHAITTRPDLLARTAGIEAGAGSAQREDGDWPWRLAAARLLIEAGADREVFRTWIAQGMDNVRHRWASGPVRKPDPAEVDAVYREVMEGLE